MVSKNRKAARPSGYSGDSFDLLVKRGSRISWFCDLILQTAAWEVMWRSHSESELRGDSSTSAAMSWGDYEAASQFSLPGICPWGCHLHAVPSVYRPLGA